jgi:hypothetical protein
MPTVDFEAEVNNGTIEIPEIYRDRVRDRVHVILQVDEPKRDKDFIDELLEQPVNVPGFQPLSRDASYERGSVTDEAW